MQDKEIIFSDEYCQMTKSMEQTLISLFGKKAIDNYKRRCNVVVING